MPLTEPQKETFAQQLFSLIQTRLRGQGATVPDLREILDKVRELIMEDLNNRTY